MNIKNTGNTPTYRKGISETIIDVTLTNDLNYTELKNWTVLNTDSLSDHAIITFTTHLQDSKTVEMFRNVRRLRFGGVQGSPRVQLRPPQAR